ncbi:MAG: hypothetical protein NC412_05785 [Roseburia sp.]|nr:hypothetical protein [Roseburia sp.]
MEQNMDMADIKMHVKYYRGEHYKEEAVKLFEEDLAYGVPVEQAKRYMEKSLSIDQQRLVSQAIRNGYPEELISVLTENGLNYFQMQEIMNAYSGGMELSKVLEIANQNGNAYEMRIAFQNVIAAMKEVKEEIEQSPAEFPQEVVDMLQRLEDSLSASNGSQDYLQSIEEQLRNMQQSDASESEAVKTLKGSIDQLERQMNDQQDRLNEAQRHMKEQESEISKLREERDEMLRQKQELEHTVEKFHEEREKPETTIPVHYQTAIPTKNGAVIPVVIERTDRRPQRGLLAMAEKLMPGKAGKNLVRQLVGKGLNREQMQAIKVAIESGLNEDEVADIIDSGFSAEEMLSAIDIVVADRKYS